MKSPQIVDALDISGHWSIEMNMEELIWRQLRATGLLASHNTVDVVAIGKASVPMARHVRALLGSRISRHIVLTNGENTLSLDATNENIVVGDHPVPGERSLAAGTAIINFFDDPSVSDVTLFLISGGASSICVVPEDPLTLTDLADLWRSALATGIDITTLNQLRAATSRISGGAILRRVRTPSCQSLIMVDNVTSGPRWVASGLTYEYRPQRSEVVKLIELIERSGSPLEEKILAAFEHRSRIMSQPVDTIVKNSVVAEPAMMLECARRRAQQLGYRVIDVGAQIDGDVANVVNDWSRTIERERARGDSICVIGVGEVTVNVHGSGRGGRCQEFAWRMAAVLQHLDRTGVFVARASDGRDFMAGVAGAWVNESTQSRAKTRDLVWSEILAANDSFRALEALGQIIDGAPTGWNLCDLYVAVL